MARSAIMSVRITGNSDDAVKAFSKVTGKAATFGSFMGGMAVKGVTALWDKLKGCCLLPNCFVFLSNPML